MNTTKINQKEYLKKYLAGDISQSGKKKKKKRDKPTSKSKSVFYIIYMNSKK